MLKHLDTPYHLLINRSQSNIGTSDVVVYSGKRKPTAVKVRFSLAQIGTNLHAQASGAFREKHPDWIAGRDDDLPYAGCCVPLQTISG